MGEISQSESWELREYPRAPPSEAQLVRQGTQTEESRLGLERMDPQSSERSLRGDSSERSIPSNPPSPRPVSTEPRVRLARRVEPQVLEIIEIQDLRMSEILYEVVRRLLADIARPLHAVGGACRVSTDRLLRAMGITPPEAAQEIPE